MLLFSSNTVTEDHALHTVRVTFSEKIKSTDAELGANRNR
jgi:hypothetical protein